MDPVVKDWTIPDTVTAQHPPEIALVVCSRVKAREGCLAEFAPRVNPIWRQLLKAPGLLGAALRVPEGTDEVWAVSAWVSIDDLYRFVTHGHHGRARRDLKEKVELPHFAYRSLRTDSMPLSWNDVEEIIRGLMRISPLGATTLQVTDA